MPITSIISWVLLVVLLCLAIEIFLRRTGSRSLAGEPDKPPNTLLGRLEELENQEALLLSVLDSAPGGIMAFRSLRDEQVAVSDFELVLAN